MIRPYRIRADDQAFTGPLLYWGGLLKATAGGAATAELWDDTQTGLFPLDFFTVAASSRERAVNPAPIFCLRGLNVDLSANVDYFIAYVDFDVPEAIAGPAGPT